MKKSLPKQRAKRPKARVMFTHPFMVDPNNACAVNPGFFHQKREEGYIYETPIAVVPCATQQQARQLVRWANLTYAQKVGQLAKALATHAYSTRVEDYHGEAKCILNLLGESPDPEN